MNQAVCLWTASNLSVLIWVYGSQTDEAYSSMGLVCSFLYGTEANLQATPQKTKHPVSLVYHIVDVGVPVHILLYGDAKVLGTGNRVKGVAIQLV